METQKFMQEVHKELIEMKKVGVRVGEMALDVAQDKEAMSEFEGMRVSECASLILEIYN